MTVGPVVVASRYRLGETLGRGGMGRVFLARDEILDRDVAIKEILLPEALVAADRDAVQERTLREARAAARISHPNAAQVYDVVAADGTTWIVMEYVRSRSLQEVIAEEGPLEPRRVAEIGLAVLGALDAAHRAGVRHRDVKPANVLLGDDGRVVLTDFGIATIEGDGIITSSDMVMGSPQYMSPERVRDGTTLPASDLWSLGATLFTAVEGHSPYERASVIETLTAVAADEPDTAQRAGVLAPVLEGLLRKDADERLDLEETRSLLEEAADGGPAVRPSRWPWNNRAGRKRAAAPAEPPAAASAGASADSPPAAPAAASADPLATAPTDPPAAAPSTAPATPPAAASASQPAAASVAASAAAPDAPPADASGSSPAAESFTASAAAPVVASAAAPVVPRQRVPEAETITEAEPEAEPPPAPEVEPRPAPMVETVTEAEPETELRPAPQVEPRPAPGVEPRPASPATSRRRRSMLAAGVAAVVLAGAGTTWYALRDDEGSPGRSTPAALPTRSAPGAANPAGTTPAGTTPGAVPPGSAPPGSAPAPSGSPSTSKATGKAGDPVPRPPLPAGWRDYRDPTGFRVYVPKGWTKSKDETRVNFRDGKGRVLGIDQTTRPHPNPVADWKGKAEYRVSIGDFPDYDEIKIVKVKYWRNAADWEFTFQGSNRRHVNNRGFVTSKKQAYGIWWETSDSRWKAERDDLQLVFDSFRPKT